MPNRILRDWTDSENVHRLSAEGERFFTRLIMKADDYGRYIADTKLLRAYLFPLHKLKEEKILAWQKECEDADLIYVYEINGKKYLEIKGFDQNLKVRRSKYPPSNDEVRASLASGYVYIIGVNYTQPVKIGFSVNPWSRLREITSNHHEKLEILLTMKSDKLFEHTIHQCLKNRRVKNEWFMLNGDLVDTFIQFSKEEIDRETLLRNLRSFSYELRSSPEVEVEVEVETETEQKPNLPAKKKSRVFGDLKAEFLKKAGPEYYFEAKDGAALKAIELKLTTLLKLKNDYSGGEPTDEEILLAWKFILEKMPSTWVKENFTLCNINGQWNVIIEQLKNSHNGTSSSKIKSRQQLAGEHTDDQRRRVMEGTL